jgi:hypothetical protein
MKKIVQYKVKTDRWLGKAPPCLAAQTRARPALVHTPNSPMGSWQVP